MSISIEWLIIADYAEVIGDKLYLQGGGWNRLTVNSDFPVDRLIGLAVSFDVPWEDTNERHSVQVELTTADGGSLGKMDGQFEVGRPVGVPAGQAQRTQLALNLPLKIGGPGTFVVVGRVDGEELRRVHFNVVPGPNLRRASPSGG